MIRSDCSSDESMWTNSAWGREGEREREGENILSENVIGGGYHNTSTLSHTHHLLHGHWLTGTTTPLHCHTLTISSTTGWLGPQHLYTVTHSPSPPPLVDWDHNTSTLSHTHHLLHHWLTGTTTPLHCHTLTISSTTGWLGPQYLYTVTHSPSPPPLVDWDHNTSTLSHTHTCPQSWI